MPRPLAVIVVNYRTAGLVEDCLRSLLPEVAALPGTQVVVVDNASGDGSAERLAAFVAAQGWGGWATVLPLADNRGFSAGNNAGARHVLAEAEPPEWLLLLNPDTVVHAGALQALLDRGGREPRTGIVGSRLENPDGSVQDSTFRFHGLANQLDGALTFGPASTALRSWALVPPRPAEACRVDWVSGASMMVHRACYQALGGLDEGYFLYYEEVDFCLRAARAGWSCWFEPRSRVVHLVGQATAVDPSRAVRRLPGYVLDSRRRYFVKNHGRAYAALADLLWIGGHLLWRLRMRLQGRPDRAAPGVLRDFIRHGALAPGPRA